MRDGSYDTPCNDIFCLVELLCLFGFSWLLYRGSSVVYFNSRHTLSLINLFPGEKPFISYLVF